MRKQIDLPTSVIKIIKLMAVSDGRKFKPFVEYLLTKYAYKHSDKLKTKWK